MTRARDGDTVFVFQRLRRRRVCAKGTHLLVKPLALLQRLQHRLDICLYAVRGARVRVILLLGDVLREMMLGGLEVWTRRTALPAPTTTRVPPRPTALPPRSIRT